MSVILKTSRLFSCHFATHFATNAVRKAPAKPYISTVCAFMGLPHPLPHRMGFVPSGRGRGGGRRRGTLHSIFL